MVGWLFESVIQWWWSKLTTFGSSLAYFLRIYSFYFIFQFKIFRLLQTSKWGSRVRGRIYAQIDSAFIQSNRDNSPLGLCCFCPSWETTLPRTYSAVFCVTVRSDHNYKKEKAQPPTTSWLSVPSLSVWHQSDFCLKKGDTKAAANNVFIFIEMQIIFSID